MALAYTLLMHVCVKAGGQGVLILMTETHSCKGAFILHGAIDCTTWSKLQVIALPCLLCMLQC